MSIDRRRVSHIVAEDVATEARTFITVPETELEHIGMDQYLLIPFLVGYSHPELPAILM